MIKSSIRASLYRGREIEKTIKILSNQNPTFLTLPSQTRQSTSCDYCPRNSGQGKAKSLMTALRLRTRENMQFAALIFKSMPDCLTFH